MNDISICTACEGYAITFLNYFLLADDKTSEEDEKHLH